MVHTLWRRSGLGVIAVLLSTVAASDQTTLSQGIEELGTQVASGITKEQKRKVAVLPFHQVGGNQTILGEYLSEELITHLYQAGDVEVIERRLLDQILGEIQLGQTGVIDPDAAVQVGRIAGADAIVTGTITVLHSYVSINCRLIDITTGRLFGAAQTRIVKDADLLELLATPVAASESADGTVNPATAAKPSASPIAESHGLRFELQRCSRRGGVVKCKLSVTSLDNDTELFLANYGAARVHQKASDYATRLIDDSGSESFSSDHSSLGTASGVFPGIRLVSGIPISLTLHFPNVPPTAQMARLLEIVLSKPGPPPSGGFVGFAGNSSEELRVQLRDIPIESG